MNTVDSSGWLEYFAATALAPIFAPIIEKRSELIVPSITIYEVHKKVLRDSGPAEASTAVGIMMRGRIILLTPSLAIDASRLSIRHKLPTADSIIYATTLANAAEVWTTDGHFKDLPFVHYFEK